MKYITAETLFRAADWLNGQNGKDTERYYEYMCHAFEWACVAADEGTFDLAAKEFAALLTAHGVPLSGHLLIDHETYREHSQSIRFMFLEFLAYSLTK